MTTPPKKIKIVAIAQVVSTIDSTCPVMAFHAMAIETLKQGKK